MLKLVTSDTLGAWRRPAPSRQQEQGSGMLWARDREGEEVHKCLGWTCERGGKQPCRTGRRVRTGKADGTKC